MSSASSGLGGGRFSARKSGSCRLPHGTGHLRSHKGAAELEFTPRQGAATVSNRFRVLLENDVVLDGIVQWSDEVARPNGMLMHQCPKAT